MCEYFHQHELNLKHSYLRIIYSHMKKKGFCCIWFQSSTGHVDVQGFNGYWGKNLRSDSDVSFLRPTNFSQPLLSQKFHSLFSSWKGEDYYKWLNAKQFHCASLVSDVKSYYQQVDHQANLGLVLIFFFFLKIYLCGYKQIKSALVTTLD